MADSPFWQFSLDFYARPKVAEACIQLQDSAGVDVNVLFFVLFMATRKRELDRADVACIDAAIKLWREEAVVPLRTLRRKLKTGIAPVPVVESDALRSAVKRLELDAERIEQLWLERSFPANAFGSSAESERNAAHANVAAYGQFLDGFPAAPVATLLAAFGER